MFKVFLAFLWTVGMMSIQAQPSINLIPFSTGYSRPVAIEHSGDNRLFIVQQRGLIIICDSVGNKLNPPFIDLSSIVSPTGNERGLLGLAFDPNYATNGYFYVNYTASSDGHTRIARYSRSLNNPDLADAASELILLTIQQPYANHNGGNLEFGHDGYLYIAMGDGGDVGDPQNYAQNPQSLLGKMLRIDVHNGNPYSIPPSNPYVGSIITLPEIWSMGWRNPWKFSFDRLTGDQWTGDVGQSAWEEINFEPANSTGGLNFGWKCYEGNAIYSAGACASVTTHTSPIYSYDNNLLGCSVTGGIVYRGLQYGDMYGYYLFADFCSGRFWATLQDTVLQTFNTTEIKDTTNFQYAAFGEDKNGELYVSALSAGTIFKIRSTQCAPAAFIQNPTATVICAGDSITLQAMTSENFAYQWSQNGIDIPQATEPTYTVTINGDYAVRINKLGAGNCVATSLPITITTKDRPIPTIAGQSDICDDAAQTHTYTVPLVNGHAYWWNIASGDGTIVAGQGTNEITVQWNSGTAGTVEVVQTNP